MPAVVAVVEGPARAVLSGERVALNLFARLSGIASLTHRFVELDRREPARRMLDTRKTTPGLRALEKYAVRCGGGRNHRAGLYDGVLVKENHLRIAGGVTAALAALGGRVDGLPVEVEAETLDQVREALDGGAPRILLDNMSPEEVREAVEVDRRPRRARGVRRRLSRHRARLRRDRSRLHLGRRAHPLRPLARRLTGGHMTVAAVHHRARTRKSARSRRERTP